MIYKKGLEREISNANFIHSLDLARSSCKKCNYSSLAEIEPAALRFRCSTLTDWTTESSCRAVTSSSCIYTIKWCPCKVWDAQILIFSTLIHLTLAQLKMYTWTTALQLDLVVQLVRALHRNHRLNSSQRVYNCIFSLIKCNECIKFTMFMTSCFLSKF